MCTRECAWGRCAGTHVQHTHACVSTRSPRVHTAPGSPQAVWAAAAGGETAAACRSRELLIKQKCSSRTTLCLIPRSLIKTTVREACVVSTMRWWCRGSGEVPGPHQRGRAHPGGWWVCRSPSRISGADQGGGRRAGQGRLPHPRPQKVRAKEPPGTHSPRPTLAGPMQTHTGGSLVRR